MPYGELIRDAFGIVIRNRHLWFFGLFVGAPSFNFQVPSSDFGGDEARAAGAGGAMGSPSIGPLEVGILVAALVIFLVVVALSVISQGALADNVAAIHRGEARGFRAGWRAGWSRFWPILGLGLLAVLIALGLVLAVGLPLVGLVVAAFALTDGGTVQVLVVIGVILVGILALVFVFVPFVVVVRYALRELVLGGQRVIESLRGGWRLFRRNVGRSLLLFLIQFGIDLGASIAVLLIAFVLALPAILLGVAGSSAALAVAIVTGVIVLAFVLAAFGAVGAFGHGFWTLAYLRLASGTAV